METTQDRADAGAPPGPRAASAGADFEAFVAERSGPLYRSAYLMTGSRHDAEDLVQTTLVKLYVSWRTVSRAESPAAYAQRVMVNAFVSGRRPARWHRERLVVSLPDSPAPVPDHEGSMDLWRHVTSLPPRQRAVVVLRYYDGLSEAEIARVMRVAPGTVKSTAAKALARLRTLMEEER